MDSLGHMKLTEASVKLALKDLSFLTASRQLAGVMLHRDKRPRSPDGLEPLDYYDNLASYTKGVDFKGAHGSEPNLFETIAGLKERSRQTYHFMRFAGQPREAAYTEAIAWIESQSSIAAARIREFRRNNFVHSGYITQGYINEPLGNALHALQDSYSEGHVTRKQLGMGWIITDINIYNADNIFAQHHGRSDKMWNSPDPSQRALSEQAVVAGSKLIINVVKIGMAETNDEWPELWRNFVSKYFERESSVTFGMP